jgi:hypothetical protein
MLKKVNLSSATLVYLCFMTVYMAVREVLPLNFLIDNTLVSAGIFALGFLLILWDLLTTRNCLNGRSQDLLIVFLAVCCISSVINYQYGIFGNVKLIAALVIEYFVFFCFTKNMPAERIQKYLNILSATLIITWFVLVAASLATYFFGIDISVANYGAFDLTSQGFSYEYVRLWGIFQDPNYASVISLVSVWASVRLIVLKKRPLLTVLLVINILCQLCYIILGGSRAALILSLATALLFAVYRFLLNGKKKTAKEALKGIGAAALTFAICLVALFGTKFSLPFVKTALFPGNSSAALGVSSAYTALYAASDVEFELVQRNAKGDVIFDTTPDKPTDPAPDKLPSDGTLKPIDRTDLGKSDISNGRFTRWIQTLQVFAKAPFFGTSPRNLSSFAKQHNPETLMAKYGMAPHNGYLDVLVETGIIGFAVLAVTVLWLFFSSVLRFLKAGFSYDRAFLVLSIIAFVGIAFFISDIYMTFSVNSMFFWIFLGMAHNLEKEPKNNGIAFSIFRKLFTKKG